MASKWQFGLLSIGLIYLLSGCRQDSSYIVMTHDWISEGNYEWAELPIYKRGSDGFEEVPFSHSHVFFMNQLTDDQIAENRNLLNGSGVAVADVTGNGFPDIYFSRLNGPNILYENLGGFQFRDITEKAGIALEDQFSTGVLFHDLNGNGYQDLVVTSIDGPNRLFFNRGDGTFDEQPGALATDRNYGSKSIGVGDLNGNGAPDLYIVNYKLRSVRDIYPNEFDFQHILQEVDGEFQLRPKFVDHYLLEQRDQFILWFETGEPDLIFFNDGLGNFKQADLTSGIFLTENGEPITEPLNDWGLHVRIDDINQNGLQDIYVANDFESKDRIWINQGNGTFQSLPTLAKRKSSLSSMAVEFMDINRDGFRDFFVVEMLSRSHSLRHKQMSTMAPSPQPLGVVKNRPQYLGNTLFLNRGDGTYAEISEYAGLRRSDWSWSIATMDVTLNGFEDILVTNGHYLDVQDSDANLYIRSQIESGQMDMSRIMLNYRRLLNQNAAFQNNGDLTFSDVSTGWGFKDRDISHGMALADLNNNGYLDLVVNRLGAEAAIYRNRSNRSRIIVRLEGELPNSSGTGSKITVEGGPVLQEKWVAGGGGYLSSSDATHMFAASDNSDELLAVTVEWPDGRVSRLTDLHPNRIYKIKQHSAVTPEPVEPPKQEPLKTLFSDGSDILNHFHRQNEFNEMERQPLLSKKPSQYGPGVTFLDLNGNGYDELLITNAANGVLSKFSYQPETSSWQEVSLNDFELDGFEQSAIAGWTDLQGRTHMITGISNYQDRGANLPAAIYHIIDGNQSHKIQTLNGFGSTVGSVTLGDFNGNGFPDLFLGGAITPGRYPEPASSRLYINQGDYFEPYELNRQVFDNIGLISGALFSDLNGDGKPELLLSEFWGTLRVFAWENNRIVETTSNYGFEKYRGWWTSVVTGDFTGNGKMDIVGLNWGENHEYMYTDDGWNHIFYDDMNQDGLINIIEAYHSNEIGGIVPRRGFAYLTQNPPFVGRRVQSFQQYSESTLEQILGRTLNNYQKVSANTYSHMIFIQQDDGSLKPNKLPQEAQFSPAFQGLIADFTGDGNQDLFLTQNYFSYRDDIPRNDAGRGLLLTGDGTGALKPIPGQESGIRIYGDQRGAAYSDINHNGRLDIAVGQNGYQTAILMNESAEPGLRVRLKGTSGNPSAIGAQLWARYADGTNGPVSEVQAGAGFRSQNSLTKVLAKPKPIVAVIVRWPDGKISESEVREGDREMVIYYPIDP